MSNPNHIIIPIVRNKPTPQQLNVFQSSALCLTPQKQPPFSKILIDKKYGSAFKRYKQKKDRKEDNDTEQRPALPHGNIVKPRKALKLKIRDSNSAPFNKNYHPSPHPNQTGLFYDPNEAPLFVSDSFQPTQPSKARSTFPEKTERPPEEIQVQLQQKIKAEPIEEEMEVKYIELNSRDDDPFIILKKTNVKKNKNKNDHTQNKTKQIRKQKIALQGLEAADKKVKNSQEREDQKIMPIFEEKHQLTLTIAIQTENYSSVYERPLSGETKANPFELRRTKEGQILSLQDMLKEGSVYESQQVQMMDQFIVSRAGVMS